MPEASIFGSLQRPKLLGAKVADIVQNGGSSIEDAPLPLDPIPKMTTVGSVPHGCN
jgi:hypothetical protein